MLKTANYSLNKPELTDLALVSKLSDNMDTIDAELFLRALKTDTDNLLEKSYRRSNKTFSYVQHFIAPSTYANDTVTVSTDGGYTADVLNVVGDFLYIGNDEIFTDIYFDFNTIMSAGTTRTWEYLATGGVWTTFIPTLDDTNNWARDGVVNIGVLNGWAKGLAGSVPNLYWLRVGTTAGGVFSTEPTLRLCIPSAVALTSPLEIYALNNDTVPSFVIDANGGIALGYADASSYRLRIAGAFYASASVTTGTISGSTCTLTGAIIQNIATTGYAHVGGLVLNAPVATAFLPNQNSPVARFSSQGWNGQVTKANAMDIYVNPDAEQMTKGRMCFKNTTVNGFPEQSEVMNLSTNGNLSVLGRIEDYYDTFDAVQSCVGGVYLDIHGIVSSVGSISGDVLNAVGDYLYVGKDAPFASAFFRFDTVMSAGTARTWEYLNTEGAWVAFTPTVDGTANWSKDGSIAFSMPADWAVGTVNTREDLYWIRVGTASGTFTVEPTLRLVTLNEDIPNANVLANPDFDTNTLWQATGDYVYATGAYTFTRTLGEGTLRQLKANFQVPAKPDTWYRMRYIVGVSAPSTTLIWVGKEFADSKVYFNGSTTEIDVYFKTNSDPQDFVIYTTATATSGFRLDFLSVMECVGGDFTATGIIKGANLSGVNTGDQDLSDYNTHNYTTHKSGKDGNFIYTTYERKRYDGTLLMRSVLSGGTSPLYTTRVETWYALNGITIVSTKTYTITYDSDGIVVSEV